MPWVRMTGLPDADIFSLLRVTGGSATWGWIGLPTGLAITTLAMVSGAWERDVAARLLVWLLGVLVLAAGGVGVTRLVSEASRSYPLLGIDTGAVFAGLGVVSVFAGLLLARAGEGAADASESALGYGSALRPGLVVLLTLALAAAIGVGSFFAAGSQAPAQATPKLIEFQVDSTSMSPVIRRGDALLVDLSAYSKTAPRRGDIIVFRAPPAENCGGTHSSSDLIKRVIGLPGETIAGNAGNVYVTGKVLPEPWLPNTANSRTATFRATRVPADSYFVMGDDRVASCDSRSWGAVPRSYIVGKVEKIARPKSSTTTSTTAPSSSTTGSSTTTTAK